MKEYLSSPGTGFYYKTRGSDISLSDIYTGQFLIKTSTVDNKGNVSIGYSINLPSFDLGNGKSIGIPIHLGGTVGTNGFKLDASIGIDLIAFKGDIRASAGGGKDNPILGLGTSLGWLNEKGGFGIGFPSSATDSFKVYYFQESINDNKIYYFEKGAQLNGGTVVEFSTAAIFFLLTVKAGCLLGGQEKTPAYDI